LTLVKKKVQAMDSLDLTKQKKRSPWNIGQEMRMYLFQAQKQFKGFLFKIKLDD